MQSILQAHLDELTRAYQYEVAKQAWHMKSSPNVSNTTIPPMDFMSSTLGSDLGATLLSEEDEEEDERYAVVSKNLCGFEYTPGHSADNLECSGKSSQQCHSDSSGTADHGAQGTHSLGHKRAPMTGLKPQADKVGTLPRRRDTNTDAHTPVMKSLHSVGSRMHSSWAAAASDPSEECMVTVSTLERQHMASWSGTSTSNRATLSRGSHKRPGTDPSHNGHPPTNSTEKREH
ncbi:Roundabout-like protein 2 [Larimichthys crocea]|uniref:Uncharacterized protein n=2 Tax=Larimichthys crocea TaxID=215358 RepID=A0ACD3R3C8_LARCR|nr:Roundabout-like protein 2 [Larimichthys crocea]